MRRRLKITKINNGAIADISFLLLIFFMVVTTFNKKYSIDMFLPPIQKDDIIRAKGKKAMLHVFINANNEIMLDDKSYDLGQWAPMSSKLESFITNGFESIVKIHIHPDSNYGTYLSLLSDIKLSKAQIKDQLSENLYDLPYKALDDLQRNIIDSKSKFSIREINIVS